MLHLNFVQKPNFLPMNKIFYLLLILWGLFLCSCNDEDIESIHKDYRFKTKIETDGIDLENLPVNGALPLVINIQKNDGSIGSYNFSYTIEQGKGILYYKDTIFNPYQPIYCDETDIKLQYVPISLGQHRLKFAFVNNIINVNDYISAKTSRQYFQLKAKNLPERLLVDVPFMFDLSLDKPDDGIDLKYPAYVKITEGTGEVVFPNQTLPDSLTYNGYLVKGNNKISYTSHNAGLNVLNFTVVNQYDLSQSVNIPLNISVPDYSVISICDSTVQAGKNNFTLKIIDLDRHGKNQFWTTFRNIKNSGSLSINNVHLESGNQLELHTGENICEFTPSELGESMLEFIVRDRYNSIRKDTVQFNVVKSPTELKISNFNELCSVFETNLFNLAVNKKNYLGQFKIEILQVPSTFQFQVNGSNYTGGRIPIINKDNTLISFIAQSTGHATITIRVYDDYGSYSEKELKLNIQNSEGRINVSNVNNSVNILTATSFNFSINKPKYEGSFQFEITSNPVGAGKLQINNKTYTGGKTDVVNPDNTLVTFIPEKLGEIQLMIRVYDKFGGTIAQDINYAVSNTNIQLVVSNLEKELNVGKESFFNFSAEKPFYDNDLQAVLTVEPADKGILYLNGEYVLPGQKINIQNKEIKTVSFLPQKEGNVKIIIEVYDNYLGTKIYPVIFNITNPPIRVEVSNYLSNAYINTENKFFFSASKESYKGKFKCIVSTKPLNAGQIKINNTVYNGEIIELTQPDNNLISFTPSVEGNVSLSLQVSDETKNTTMKSFEYIVENPPLVVNFGNFENDLSVFQKSSINFSVSKNNYKGNFYSEIFTENCTDIKINNQVYISGERELLSSPTNTVISFTPTTVDKDVIITVKIYDDWGGSIEKKINLAVNNSDINLELTNLESKLIIGKETHFNLLATKPQYKDNLTLELITTPEDAGYFKIDGKEYISGKRDFKAETPLDLIFMPLQEGEINVGIMISDKFGGKKTRQFQYKVTNPEIEVEVTDFISSAILNSETFSYITVKKQYYTEAFSYNVTTTPSNAGTLKINDTLYTEGSRVYKKDKPIKLSFIPKTTGNISLNVNISDNTGKQINRKLNYSVATYPTILTIANQETGLTIDKPTSFHFSVSQKNYTGTFLYEITTEPVVAGNIQVNNKEYSGGKTEISNLNNTQISFTPSIIGDIKFFISVYDNQDIKTTKEINYSVKNSGFNLIISNLEKEILLGKVTEFNFSVIKENYNKTYQYEINLSPQNCGNVFVNGSAYQSGKQLLTTPVNTIIKFVSNISGNNALNITVYDENGDKTEKTLYFNSQNPPIQINTTSREDNLVINTPTKFSVDLKKEFYNGDFFCQIEQEPANSGEILIGDLPYGGGITKIEDPQNLQISFIPRNEGNVNLKLLVKDQVNGNNEQSYLFRVINPDINVNINNHTKDIIVGESAKFNFSISKSDYTGKFYYQITQDPTNNGEIKINNIPYDGGKYLIENINSNTVEYIGNKLGATILYLTISDEWDKSVTIPVNFSVSNSDIFIDYSGKEYTIQLNKPTSFIFQVKKPNYSDSFEGTLNIEPESAGEVIINDSEYSHGSLVNIEQGENLFKFTPKISGAILLKLKVRDKLRGEKEVAWNFNSINPEINITINNQERDLIFNTPTSFNINVNKDYYKDGFKYQFVKKPADAGNIKVNGQEYTGGFSEIPDPDNFQITFTPEKEGNLALLLNITDQTNNKAQKEINFTVINPDISLRIGEYVSDIIVNSTSINSFTVDKVHYTGKLFYQITQQPADMGTIKINDVVYKGEKINITDKNANSFTFTANKLGSASLKLEVTDEWGKSAIKYYNYSISNSDILVNVKNKEFNLILNKETSFSFDTDKPNYTGDFETSATLEPENSGELKINNSAYTQGEWIKVNKKDNAVLFTPKTTGAVLLKLKTRDNFGKEKEIALNFNVINPDIEVNVSNKADNITKRVSTHFNLAFTKTNYTDKFQYEITSQPVNAGSLKVNNSVYDGGILDVANPQNMSVDFTPEVTGLVVLYIKVLDNTGYSTTKILEFNVENPPLSLIVNNPTTNLSTGQTTKFSVKASKTNYTGNFKYEITQYPYASGEISVAGVNSNTGTLTSDPAEITYKPKIVGNTTLKIDVKDDWGGYTEKQIDFNIKDTPLTLDITNQENNVILNQTTTFNLSITKENYSDNQNIYFSISPSRQLVINNKGYSGGTLQMKYGDIKKGIPVSYTPTQAGTNSLTIYTYDEYNQNVQKTINYNTSNPELNVFLSGINESGNNPVNLNETYKFTLNVNKEYYTDDFAYWITVSPADAALIATSDITPRSRALNSSGTITGSISSSEYGMSSAEIRVTPNNQLYLNQNISLQIRIRDKWNNEVNKSVVFDVSTSQISLDVVRNNTSIPVLIPYKFYFTTEKPNYSGKFKFSIVGMSDNDIIQISDDGSQWTTYLGGKQDVKNIDHTYIQFTPGRIGTVPLKIIVYDENNSFIEKDISFDIKSPEINIAGGGVKVGLTDQYIPFDIVATDEQNNNMNLNFEVDSKLDGIVTFNSNAVYNSQSRASTTQSPTTIVSGVKNKLEMMSRKQGSYSTVMTVSNVWSSSASTTSSINVEQPVYYSLNVTKEGEGAVNIQPQKSEYTLNEQVKLTATPVTGWQFSHWEGNLSGTNATQQLVMNDNKNIKAVFVKAPKITAYVITRCKATGMGDSFIANSSYIEVTITEVSTGTVIYNKKRYHQKYAPDDEIQIDQTSNYKINITTWSENSQWADGKVGKYQLESTPVNSAFPNGSVYIERSFTVPGSAFISGTKKTNITYSPVYALHYN